MEKSKEMFAAAIQTGLLLFLATGAWYISGLAALLKVPLGVTALYNYLKAVPWITNAVEMAAAGGAIAGIANFFKIKKAK